MDLNNYFPVTQVTEAYAKNVTVSGITKKFITVSVMIKGDNGVQSLDMEVNGIYGSTLLNLMTSAGYFDNPSTEQLADIPGLTFVDVKNSITYLENSSGFTIAYDSVSKPNRLYRFQLDITGYDGSDELHPNYKDIWAQSPIIIHGNIEGVTGENRPKISLALDIADCEDLINSLYSLIDSEGAGEEDNQMKLDLDFLKDIINGTAKIDGNAACAIKGVTLPEFNLPNYEDESILFELTNIDRLICYLKQQILKYKTEIAVSSGSASCYSFVPCLIKGYVALNKFYRRAVSIYNTLHSSASTLKLKYIALADDHRRGINALIGIKNSVNSWIKSTLDGNFNLDNVTCSNVVDVVGGNNVSFVDKYSSYVNYTTKKIYNI